MDSNSQQYPFASCLLHLGTGSEKLITVITEMSWKWKHGKWSLMM